MIDYKDKPDGATHYIKGAMFDPSYIQYLKKVDGGYSAWSYMKAKWMNTITVDLIAKYGREVKVIDE